MTTPKEQAGWQPIETAPKDETHILLWRPNGNSRHLPVIGFYSSWNRWWTTGEVDRFHDHVPLWAPTHWMPLPAPPEPAA